MKNQKFKALAVAVAGATSLSLAAPAAQAVEINRVDLNNSGNTCQVTFTDREKANFARIQVQAAKDFVAAYDANKANLTAVQREFIDAQSMLDADYLSSEFLGQSLPEAEKAVLRARADKAETDWYAWVDVDPANREQFRYSLRSVANTLGMAQFAVAAASNNDALFKAFVENKGNGSRNGDLYTFGPINEKYTANDELSMYYSVDLPERSSFRPNETIISAMETFLTAVHVPHILTAQYACAEYAKTFTEEHPLADELARGKDAVAIGSDSGNDEYNQAVVRVPKIEALIAQGTVPTDIPAYFVSEKLADDVTGDVVPQPSLPDLPGSSDNDLGGIFGIIASILGALGLLAALIPNLSQILNLAR